MEAATERIHHAHQTVMEIVSFIRRSLDDEEERMMGSLAFFSVLVVSVASLAVLFRIFLFKFSHETPVPEEDTFKEEEISDRFKRSVTHLRHFLDVSRHPGRVKVS